MFNRLLLSVVVTTVLLLTCGSFALGDDKADAIAQLTKGMSLFRDGDTAKAKSVLEGVDADQLDKAQKITLTEVLAELKGTKAAAAPDVIAQAPAAVEAAKAAPADKAVDAKPDAKAAPDAKADDVKVDDAKAAPDAKADAAPAAKDPFVDARKLLVAEALTEAGQHETNGHYRLAVQRYKYADSIEPGNAETLARLNAALAKVDSRLGGSPIGNEIERGAVAAQAAIAEFNQLIADAKRLRAGRDYLNSQQAIQQAKVRIDDRRSVLGETKYSELRKIATELYAAVSLEAITVQGTQEVERVGQDRKDAEIARIKAKIQQYEAVQRLLRRAADLRKAQDYDRSLQLVNQALFLDPNNPAAQAMKVMIEDTQIITKSREFVRIRDLRMARTSMELIEATVPYNELITYPADWPQLTAHRLGSLGQGSGDTEMNRRVQLKLQEPLPINFEANRMVNVMDYFRNTTGVNYFVNWAALEAAGVEQDTPITLQLSNIPADQALRLVLQQAGGGAELEPIGFSIIDGVVTVSTQRDLTKTTDTRVYDIRDLLVQIPRFTGAPEFDLNSALSNTSSGGSSGGAQSSTTLFEDADEVETITREEMIEQITALIQDTVGNQPDWAAYGGEVSSLRELNGNLIVKTTPDNHRDMIKLLGQLRSARAMQIHIESRFLLVESNFLEEIGVDLDFQININDRHFPNPIGIGQDSFGMTSATSNGFPGSFTPPTSGQFNGNPSISPSAVAGGPSGFQNGTGFTPNSRALDFGLTYLGDIDVNLLVRATQANRKSISLTAPRLTLFNGQRAHVMVARQIGFVSDLEPVSGAIGFDPTLSVTQSGVVLDVEATVSADKRYVTMTARPSLATVVQPLRSIPVQGGGVIGGGGNDQNGNDVILFTGFIEAPELELTSVRTSVSVPDRGTLMMGGQRVVGESEVEVGVPILSKIPVLSRFFTNRTTVRDERTLLILIKPTIIIQEEQEDAMWPGLNADPQGYNAGRAYNPHSGVGEVTGP